jgi:ribosomal protein L16 Arg81 hydroxylase
MRAPVHFDDHDLIVVHLRGTKRWHISQKPSELNNVWRGLAGSTPELGPHETFDVSPGELVYLPRGTLHSVDGNAESLHVSIGFTPLTLREAIIAALDHLSDFERPLRATLGNRLASQIRGVGLEALRPPILTGVAHLLEACKAPGFLEAALQLRSGRGIAALRALPSANSTPITLDTLMIQTNLACCHLTANPEKIDFSYPGGHIYIHRGAQESLVYMVNTAAFRVREIPGQIDDQIRLSLAEKLREVGFLEVQK